MHYDAIENRHGLKHDPLKALVVPRPIGWVATVSAAGVLNLAPYSFFNAVGEKPGYVVIASGGRKDSLCNIEETGEFTCSMATYDLRKHMNISSATVSPNVDEFELSGLTVAKSHYVRPPRVKESPAALECRLHQIVLLPGAGRYRANYSLVIGQIVGIHIDDRYIKDGMVDVGAMRPIARLGYMDYATVTAESMFSMNRPEVDADGTLVSSEAGNWDGVFR
jgi:flavin reductase (DIM6/NTAB) family NADH-FMN oxidoreductase RutF